MSTSNELLHPADPPSALQLSQKAPLLFSRAETSTILGPLSFLISSETPESWTDLEKLFLACLQTGDDKSAHFALERLTQRFGAHDERVMALRGLYQEAVANDLQDLKLVVEDYNRILRDNPMNVPIHKRRIAIMRSIQQDDRAADALVDFLESFPTDAEAWSELSDVYKTQGLAAQSIYCLEEALLSAPNAWNLHARLGELEYMAAVSDTEGSEARRKHFSQALKRFGRSVELCDDYLRGYYGLATTTARLLDASAGAKGASIDDISQDVVQNLHQLAIRKLSGIVSGWSKARQPGMDESEVIAAQELLNRMKR